MARGNNKMRICLDDLDYAWFLQILEEVVEKFEVDCWVFCVMPNHYHLVFRTRRANLSRAMRSLNGRYAQWWNSRHAHVGHVFQGRFKAQVIESSVYLLRLCRYVLLNPVRGGLCADPGDWQWSSLRALTGGTTSSCIDVNSLVATLGDGTLTNVHARLVDYVNPDADPEMAAFIRSDQRVIGTDAFAAQFQRRARRAPKEVPRRDRRVGTPALTAILVDAVRSGEGLVCGIRRAHSSGPYTIADIARCAGLARQTVVTIVKGRPRRKREPGTGR